MIYTDAQIKNYVRELEAKGAPPKDIEAFVTKALAERNQEDVKGDSFLKRLRYSFGSAKERESIQEPKGFGKGGFAEMFKDVADVAGKALPVAGMLGLGALGSIAGPGGSVAGAVAGGAEGEKIRQDIGSALGLQKDTTMTEQVKEIGTEGALAGFGEVGGRATVMAAKPILKSIVQPVIRNAKSVIKDIVSVMTSVPEKAIERAAADPAVREGFTEAVSATTIRQEALNAYKAVKERVGQEFKDGLNALKEKFKTGVPSYPNQQFTKKVNDAVAGLPAMLRKFRIGVVKGMLNFDRSSIVKGTEQTNLQKVYDTIMGQRDFSVEGVEAVAERINALSEFVEGAKTKTSVIITKIHKIYDKAIEKSFPELGKLRKAYGVSSQMLTNADKIIRASAGGDVRAVRSAVGKLTNLFKEDNDVYINALMALEEASGGKFLSKLAGTEFQRTMPGLLRTSLAVGGVATLLQSPAALLIAPLFSPRFWGGALTRSAQAKVLLNRIFMNASGGRASNAALKVLINDILRGKVGEEETE